MKKSILFLVATVLSAGSILQASEFCDASSHPLYKEIQIYNQTEKIQPDEGLVGDVLSKNLARLRFNGSTKQKVMALETSFAKCVVMLSAEDEQEIDMAVETVQKMENPLFVD